MIATSDKYEINFLLSGGETGDALEGRKLMGTLGEAKITPHLLMDKAYKRDETQTLAYKLGYMPVVTLKGNRKNPWAYDKVLYKSHNQIERLFCKIKRFRYIFTHYDKLDIIYTTFILFALIVDALN